MKKFLMLTLMLTGLGYAASAKGNEEGKKIKETNKSEQYCYGGMTACGSTYMACLTWQLSIEEQIALNESRERADCGGGGLEPPTPGQSVN